MTASLPDSNATNRDASASPLVIRCKKCDKPYRNKAPLLVWVEGKGMQPPEPDQDWWLPACRCKPREHYIVGQS